MPNTWTLWAENPEHEFLDICRKYEVAHGLKRGRALFAARCGITERRLKAILYEGGRLYADEWLRVMAAHQQVRREHAAKLRATLALLEGEMHAGMAMAGGEPHRGVVG